MSKTIAEWIPIERYRKTASSSAAAAVSVPSANSNGDADTESAAYAAAGLRIQRFVVFINRPKLYCLSVWLIIK